MQTYPPAELMRRGDEPRPPPEIVTSTHARDTFWADVQAWGRRESAKLGGVCAWAKERGMKDAPC